MQATVKLEPIQDAAATLARSPILSQPPTVIQPSPVLEPIVRLVIEEDAQTGSFIYKTLDSSTGEVISQLPREEVLKLKDQAEYEAGDLVDTTA